MCSHFLFQFSLAWGRGWISLFEQWTQNPRTTCMYEPHEPICMQNGVSGKVIDIKTRDCTTVLRDLVRIGLRARITFVFLAEKSKKMNLIQNFALNHIYFNSFSNKTCQKKKFKFLFFLLWLQWRRRRRLIGAEIFCFDWHGSCPSLWKS